MTHGVKMSVSVIVPVYNAERFLDQCLLSIRNQFGCDLEVICVNDGSTDCSLEMLRRHSAEDSRIRVIDKENGGYGSACNRGLTEASGEWISIVEPDDWIEPGMYGDMLAFAEALDSDVDIIKTPWWNINDWDCSASDQYRTSSPLSLRLRQSGRPFALSDHPELIEYHPSIWSALYRRSFILDRGIRFIEYPGAGWADNPLVQDGTLRVFASMDPKLVMSSSKIDPRRKRFFCSVMGLNYSDGHALSSLMYSMREQLIHLRCLGIKGIESRVRYRLSARY